MRKVLCSYGTIEYKKSLHLLEKSAFEIGNVDEVYLYNREWLLNTDFYKKNKYILDQKRGGGFWLYKTYIILETLKNLSDGDIVMYSDAGVEIIDNLEPLYKISELNNIQPILFRLPGGHRNKTWTKRDTFILTNCDTEEYWDGHLTNGAFSLWKKNINCVNLLNEWQKYNRDIRIIGDGINLCGMSNFMDFREHRHDQSVLSLLSIKYNFELFRSPCQWANNKEDIDKFQNSNYGQLVNHHRGAI